MGMTKHLQGLAVGATLLLSSLAGAEAPELQAGIQLSQAGYYHSAPEVADWNGDGKKDLVIGEFYNADVRVFPNTGTDAAPAFLGSSLVKASGTNIQLNYG
jgi:hypothetical protein